MQKEVNGLITEYELSVLSARDEISTLKEELYGNNLNQFIQSGLAGFVENNIDKIAEFAESDKEYPDFWDTVTASVSNIDWTEVLSGDSFLDIISNATDSIRTSITEGITSYLSGVVSASIPPLTDIFFYDYSSFGTDSFGGFVTELVNNIEGLNVLELMSIIDSISRGNLDENTINMLRDMLQVELPDATKKAIADAARILMGRLHEDAYNELKESVGEGRTSIIDALDQTGEAVKAFASDSLDYLKKLTDVAEAEIKERYSWFVVEKTWDALSSAFDAYEAYYEYSESFTPAKLIELEETLNNAKAEVKDAKRALRTLQKNAEKAEKA